MTAPAPRNHPAEDARPAPTPAPVAVPEGLDGLLAGNALCVAADERARIYEGAVTDVTLAEADAAYLARVREIVATYAPRRDPVVPPLPSEAVTDAAVEAAARALYLEEQTESMGFDQWPDYDHPDNAGRPIYEHHAKEALAAALPHLRLVPEDDEDTVWVPRGHSTAGHCHDADGGLHHEPGECPGAVLGCDGRCCS